MMIFRYKFKRKQNPYEFGRAILIMHIECKEKVRWILAPFLMGEPSSLFIIGQKINKSAVSTYATTD